MLTPSDGPTGLASTTAVAEPFEDHLQINTPEPRQRSLQPPAGRNTLISALRTSHSTHVHVLSASVKFAVHGQIDVETRRGVYRLNNTRFLVLNAWEPYTFQIAPRSTAQTFSLFFRARYLASLQDALVKGDADLLEQPPDNELSSHLEFPEVPFPTCHHSVGRQLLALFRAWQAGTSQHCLSDRVRDVGEALIDLRSNTLSQRDGIHAAKRSTREELYRRVQLASLFVRENYAKDIDLNRVAQQAGMSPHHLHRTFRAIHGFTLHQWVVQLRLNEAKRLLQKTDIPISGICRRVGYSSLPSFTNLFRSRFGRPPVACRRSGLVD